MKNVQLIKHPLVDHSLTILRDKNTDAGEFRRHADIVSKILIVEALKNLQTASKSIQTPLASFMGQELKDRVVVVPILRAGLAMLSAAQDLLPELSVGFIGLERDEKTAIAGEYYEKLPKITANQFVIIVDPMLATGGSMDKAIKDIKARGSKRIMVVSIVCSPEGLKNLTGNHPEIPVITVAIDERLDENAYIVPGLGDFGDRYFDTV